MAWLLAAIVTGCYLAIASAAGALGVARNDDWSFIANAFRFHETGIFAVSGWVQMMLIGQLVLAWPIIATVGESIAALQALTALLGTVLLASSYLFARTLLGRRWSVLVAFTLALSPLFGSLSVSFMTDLPAATFQVGALLLAVKALRTTRASRGWLIAASGVALYGFSIREYAVTAIVTIWLVALIGGRTWGLRRRFLVSWTVGLGAIGLALLVWRASQVTDNTSAIGWNPAGLEFIAWIPLTIGCLLLPVAAFLNPVAVARTAWQRSRVLAVGSVVLVLGLVAHTRLSLIGNYLSPYGGYAEVLRGQPELVVPAPLWGLFILAGLLSVIVLTLLLVIGAVDVFRSLRDRGTAHAVSWVHQQPAAAIAVAFLLLNIAIFTIVPISNSVSVFDRYLLPLIPIGGAIAAWQGRRLQVQWHSTGRALGGIETAIFIVVSLLVVTSTAALDGARWRIGTAVAQRFSVARGNVDAGFDWFRFHTDGSPAAAGAARWTWWTLGPAGRAVCLTLMHEEHSVDPVAASPDPSLRPILTEDVWSALGGARRIVVLPGPDTCPEVTR